MFFSIIGWLALVIIALGATIGGPIVIGGLSQFGGGSGKAGWIPFGLGCVALYFLFTNAPFHIVLS